MVLFIWNVASVVDVAGSAGVGGLAAGLAVIAGFLNISDTMESFDHNKSSSISKLIKSKLRDLQKLLKYFNGKSTLCPMCYY